MNELSDFFIQTTRSMGLYKVNVVQSKNLENKKPLIAIHGWLDNHASFTPLMKQHPEWPWVSIDLVGHGMSEWRPEKSFYYFFDYLCDLIQFIEDEYSQGVHLIGHSLGAAITSLAAGILPDLVKSVVLLDGLGPLVSDSSAVAEQLRLSIYQHRQLKPLRMYDSIETMALARQKKHHIHLNSCKLIVEGGSYLTDKGYRWSFDPKLFYLSPVQMTQEQVLSILGTVNAPVHLIKAIEGYPFDNELVEQRRKALKYFSEDLIPGGHHVHMDSPALVSLYLEEFYQKNKVVF
jgi:pimeloyl-ACP methyl ester carboxylesterase